MKRIILVAAAVFAAVAFNAPWAQAHEEPWCAVVGVGRNNTNWDCRYSSFEACVPNAIAGLRGFCNQNPNFVGWSAPAKRARIHRKHHAS